LFDDDGDVGLVERRGRRSSSGHQSYPFLDCSGQLIVTNDFGQRS